MPVRDRNGEYLEQLDIIRNNQRADTRNSPQFIQMNQRLSALNEAMNKMSGAGYLMTSEDISELRILYAEAGEALEAYLKHLPTWVPDRWRSPEGLARQAGVETLRGFMKQDLAALDSYNPKNPMRLTEFLRDARSIVVNEPNQMEKIGDRLSTREVIEQNGQKGVFTENAVVTRSKLVFEDVVNRRSVRYGPADAGRPVMDAVQRLAREHRTLRNLVRDLPVGTLSDLGRRFKENDFFNLDRDILEMIDRLKDNIQRENYPYKIITTDQEAAVASQEDRNFNTLIGELLEESARIKGSSDNLDSMDVERGRSIGDRNTAMSIVGDLIYCPDILARSTDMKLKLKNGNVIRGSYMEWTKGQDIQYLSRCAPNNPEERKNLSFDFDSPKIIQDAGDLLALDYICGNTDRHMANFHVIFEKDPDGVYRYKGLQGIDNDLSFPVFGPKQMEKDKLEPDSHTRLPEDIVAMKESTAQAIMNLTKEKLTFALCHKLTKKEIDAAWERTQYLQNHIRKGMTHEWMSDDEIHPGQIHVIPDKSKAWDGINLSAVAHASPHLSFYHYLNNEFDLAAKPNIAQARAEAVRELEVHDLIEQRRVLQARRDPAVTGNPNWLNDQVGEKVKSNRERLETSETQRKRLAPDGPLKPILNQTQINLDYFDRERGDHFYQNAEDMYNVYHSRRNLTLHLARNAADVLRKIEKEQMSHLFAPGYESHSAVRAAGMEKPTGRYFIDGEPAEQYARRKYWSRAVEQEYNALPDQRSKKTYMENFVSAHILAAMTGGRHHVDVAVLAQGEQGLVQVRLFEAKMNLDGADWNGRQARINSITSDLKNRKTRQDAIRNRVKTTLQAKFDDGTLNAFRDTVREMKRIYHEGLILPQSAPGQVHQQADNQAGGNPHRQERIRLEALEEPRPRGNSVNQNPHPDQNARQANRNGAQADQNNQAVPGLRANAKSHS